MAAELLLLGSAHDPALVGGSSSPLPLTHEEATLQVEHRQDHQQRSHSPILAC